MLVLTRKRNQEIMLGDDIKITILEIRDDVIKIGIDAPKEMTILRGELYQAVKTENITAGSVDAALVNSLKGLFKK